jgi:hypothetical protein
MPSPQTGEQVALALWLDASPDVRKRLRVPLGPIGERFRELYNAHVNDVSGPGPSGPPRAAD